MVNLFEKRDASTEEVINEIQECIPTTRTN